ncbi:MAG: hypothetical protein JWO17_952 [Actinomycetia bacterium]|nr:hypothetical protein [Actinomycetes bacterium]
MSRHAAVLRDRELVELLGDQPELLAIADAIAATAQVRRRRIPPRLLVASLTVVAAAAVGLVGPWSSSRGGVLQRALAAVSTRSVLHVVLVSPIPETQNVDLRTGKATPTMLRVETWFDAGRALRKSVVTRNGTQTAVELATPQGVWSESGRVPTCAWIAAHPAQATKLRVSCSASGHNAPTPRHLAEARPTADPALAAFITGYRQSLRSGRARSLGPGHVGRRAVYWITFDVSSATTPRSERVAIDRHTYQPVLVQTVTDGQAGVPARVEKIGSIAYTPSLFKRPTLARPQPAAGSVAKSRHVSRAVAETALRGHARSLGASFASLPLIDARIDRLTTGYGPLSGRPFTHGSGAAFIYGANGMPLNGTPFLRISEALSPQMAYGLQPEGASLRAGVLVLTRFGNGFWTGKTRAGALYVALQGSSRQLLVSAARAIGQSR